MGEYALNLRGNIGKLGIKRRMVIKPLQIDILEFHGSLNMGQVFFDHSDMQSHKLAIFGQTLSGCYQPLYRTASAAIGMDPARTAAQVIFVGNQLG